MKNEKSTSKLSDRLINIIMQLLRWMTKLELSGGAVGETDIGLSPPEKGCELQVAGFLNPNSRHSELRTLKGNKMKPNNRLTKQFMKLLRWMAHLELSGGIIGDQDIWQLMPEPALAGSQNENKNFKNIHQNENKMKAKNRILKWLALLFVLFAGTMGAWAQPSGLTQSGDHSVCIGQTKDYGVDPTASTTYLWTITPIAGGNGTFTTGTTSNLTSIIWTTEGTARLELSETNATGCNITVSIVVTVNPLPVVTTGTYGPVCTDAADITLAGSPAGGVWTGTGVSGTGPYVFDPSVGTQTLTYTYTDGSSCINSATTSITVNPLPTPLVSGTDPICGGSSATYSTPATGNNFTWTVIGGTFTGQGTNQISVTWDPTTVITSGSVSVMETIGTTSCNATDTKNIVVNPTPTTSTIYHN